MRIHTLVEGIHCKKLTFLSRRPIRLQAPPPPPRHLIQAHRILVWILVFSGVVDPDWFEYGSGYGSGLIF